MCCCSWFRDFRHLKLTFFQSLSLFFQATLCLCMIHIYIYIFFFKKKKKVILTLGQFSALPYCILIGQHVKVTSVQSFCHIFLAQNVSLSIITYILRTERHPKISRHVISTATPPTKAVKCATVVSIQS